MHIFFNPGIAKVERGVGVYTNKYDIQILTKLSQDF